MPKKKIGRQNTEAKQHNFTTTTADNQEQKASYSKTSKGNKTMASQ